MIETRSHQATQIEETIDHPSFVVSCLRVSTSEPEPEHEHEPRPTR
jgi:hypothetical protein